MFRRPLDAFSAENSRRGGYADIRMVYTGVDIRVERDIMLRRHLPGRQQNAQDRLVLDEFYVLRHIHRRAYAKMDSVGRT